MLHTHNHKAAALPHPPHLLLRTTYHLPGQHKVHAEASATHKEKNQNQLPAPLQPSTPPHS